MYTSQETAQICLDYLNFAVKSFDPSHVILGGTVLCRFALPDNCKTDCADDLRQRLIGTTGWSLVIDSQAFGVLNTKDHSCVHIDPNVNCVFYVTGETFEHLRATGKLHRVNGTLANHSWHMALIDPSAKTITLGGYFENLP